MSGSYVDAPPCLAHGVIRCQSKLFLVREDSQLVVSILHAGKALFTITHFSLHMDNEMQSPHDYNSWFQDQACFPLTIHHI